jgi:tetratricopeptide (TPR) repeat protein
MMSLILFLCLAVRVVAADASMASLRSARDAQDRATLQKIAEESSQLADRQASNAGVQYQAALANSTLAEVAAEIRDKALQRAAAEAGLRAAEKAAALKPDDAESRRIHGTLCGQVAAALGGLSAFKYGKCALDEIERAIQLDPKSPLNYLSRGIGNYYLPAALGGGADVAVKDFEKAISLDPKFADAYLWLGVALRKANRNSEARSAFQQAVKLNPARAWAKQQLAKIPSE